MAASSTTSRSSAPSSATSSKFKIEPPSRLVQGSPEDSEAARQNFHEREEATHRFSFLHFRRNKATPLTRKDSSGFLKEDSDSSTSTSDPAPPSRPANASRASFATVPPSAGLGSRIFNIQLHDGTHVEADPDEERKAAYRWAFVYENQRGTLWFRNSRFSSKALFSFDPPAFSIVRPGPEPRRDKQPIITLEEYPQPDGRWQWLSEEWMIDMRDGKVQHDGFEYNWTFRSKNWRPRAGRFNTGALVRRRRWARLMVRPALEPDADNHDRDRDNNVDHPVTGTPSGPVDDFPDCGAIWKGDEGDWERSHSAIRTQESDGRKLELWQEWVEHEQTSETRRQKQWTNDSQLLPSELERNERMESRLANVRKRPHPDFIAAVLRDHGVDILHTFVYPSSRTKFMELLLASGLISEMPTNELANSLQFWSRIKAFTSVDQL